MKSLFPDIELEPTPRHASRAMAGRRGRGPAGETCGSCGHCLRVPYNAKHYYKCALMRPFWTRAAGTDIRLKWAACEYWREVGADGQAG